MLLYSPSWLYFVPGLILLVLGVVGALALAAGPVTILGRTWQIHSLFLCMFAILLGTQVVQLGVFARAFAAAHLGETDALVERAAQAHAASSTASPSVGSSFSPASSTLLVIFVSWAIDGFGALSHEYATAVGFTLVALGDPGDPRVVLPRPADDAHHGAVTRDDRGARPGRVSGYVPLNERPRGATLGCWRWRSSTARDVCSTSGARPATSPGRSRRPAPRSSASSSIL